MAQAQAQAQAHAHLVVEKCIIENNYYLGTSLQLFFLFLVVAFDSNKALNCVVSIPNRISLKIIFFFMFLDFDVLILKIIFKNKKNIILIYF
jgi:hypothetical protein